MMTTEKKRASCCFAGSLCRSLAFFVCLVLSEVSSLSVLTVPPKYTLLEGPLQFSYHAPRNFTSPYSTPTIEVISTADNRTIATVSDLGGLEEASMSIDCGTLDVPGTYVFRFRDQTTGSPLDDDHVTQATWPTVSVSLPPLHRTLGGDVTLSIGSEEELCDSVQPDVTYRIQVVYLGDLDSSESSGGVGSPKHVAFEKTIRSLYSLNGASITLPCRLIDQAGVYRAVLRSSRDPRHPVAVSDPLSVRWSDEYGLDVGDRESVYPCSRHLTVSYRRPHCAGDSDKVRLYRQVVPLGQQVAPLEYVTEQRAKGSQDHVVFPCSRFNASAVGYCFKYVSTAQNGAVREQRMKCLPTNVMTDDSPGGVWSGWSQWSVCSGCGSHRSRFRTCDNPDSGQATRRPWTGPRYCPGKQFDSSACSENHCAGVTVVMPSSSPSSSSSSSSVTSDPLCACGCKLTRPEGRIVAVAAGCRRLPVHWRVEVGAGHVIRLTFERFDLDDATRVKVRDGVTLVDELLVNSFGGSKTQPPPTQVTTTQNRMLVEYDVMGGGGAAKDRYSQDQGQGQGQGFVAVYTAIAAAGKDVDANDGGRNGGGVKGKQAIWESAVTVTGIALCILIVVVSVGFVVHHRIAQRRTRAKLKQTPAHRALLGPPSASAPAGDPAPRSHRHRSPSSVTPAGSRRASEAERGGPRTPGSVRAASGMSPMMSPHNPVRTRPDPSGTTPDSLRKQRSGVPSPALSLRSRSQQQQQQPQSKMMMLEQLRHQRRNLEDEGLSPPSKMKNAARSLASNDVTAGRHEDIRMGLYFRRNRKQIQDDDDEDDDGSFVYEQRPPVEGQDSLTRDKPLEDELNDLEGGALDLHKAKFVPPKKSSVAEIRDLRSGKEPRSLDLIPGYRTTSAHPATTPTSITSAGELSAALERTDLFLELDGGRGADDSPCDFITTDEFEYDDYVSHLPGSYFTMDPQAYTLTWSQQPPSWAVGGAMPPGGKALVCPSASRTNSEASIDPDRIY